MNESPPHAFVLLVLENDKNKLRGSSCYKTPSQPPVQTEFHVGLAEHATLLCSGLWANLCNMAAQSGRREELPEVMGAQQSCCSGGRPPLQTQQPRPPIPPVPPTHQAGRGSCSLFPGSLWEPGSPSKLQHVLFQGRIHFLGPKDSHLTHTKAMS